MLGNRQTFQRSTSLMLLTVDAGAFFVLVKFLLGGFRVAVNFPATAAFAAVRPLTDETLYILRGIAQEQANFMGKVRLGAEFAGQFLDAVLTPLGVISPAAQQGSSIVLAQILAQFAGTVKVNQGFGL